MTQKLCVQCANYCDDSGECCCPFWASSIEGGEWKYFMPKKDTTACQDFFVERPKETVS